MTAMERRGEAGDTLTEVLIAIAVLGLCLAALLGALLTSLRSSVEHRSFANIDAVLRSYSEAAKSQIELGPSPLYQPCPSVTNSSYAGQAITLPADAPLPPVGWTSPFIVGLQFLHDIYDPNSQTNVVSGPDSVCTSGPSCNPQPDYQLLTVGVLGPDGSSQNLTIGLRDPSC